ncbi:xylulokinase [Planctomycetota bacterium]
MAKLLGIDIGTSSVKALLVDAESRAVVAEGNSALELSTPVVGYAEQNPSDWWGAAVQAVRQITTSHENDVDAVSFSGQMHGLVLLDEHTEVIRPAILWCDTRCTEECRILERELGLSWIMEHLYNPPLEGFTLPKLTWVRRHEEDNYKRARLLLLPKDYVRYRLTGEIYMEHSDGAGTLMQDIKNRNWSVKLLDRLEIDHSLLPPLIASTAGAGNVNGEAAELTGLKHGTPVFAGGADNTAAACGSGVISEGVVSVSLGSSGVVFGSSKTLRCDPRGRIHTFNHSVPGLYYNMGVMQAAGLALRWFRDNFAKELAGKKDAYDQLCAEAAQAGTGAGGVFFMPYLMGERTPHLDGTAKGGFLGISAAHNRGHLVRALLEGVAFGLRDCIEIFKTLGVPLHEIRLLGGGAGSELWAQIIADTCNEPIHILNIAESPAYGAALIAGVGCGIFTDFQQAAGNIDIQKTYSPRREDVEVYDSLYPKYQRIYQATLDYR